MAGHTPLCELRFPGGKSLWFEVQTCGTTRIYRTENGADEMTTTHFVLPAPKTDISSWFPLIPQRPQGAHAAGSRDKIFSIDRLSHGTFDKELGGAGAHGALDTSSPLERLKCPGRFDKRSRFEGDETEEDYISLIPELLLSCREHIDTNPGEFNHPVQELVGCIFEFLICNQAEMFGYNLGTARGAIQEPGIWLNWAKDQLPDNDD